MDLDGRRLEVWSWRGRDRSSLADLVLLVALSAKSELQAASTRLGLPKPDVGYGLVKPGSPAFDMAMAEPGHVFWTDGEGGWQREEALDVLRRTSRARSVIGGRLVTPVQRQRP